MAPTSYPLFFNFSVNGPADTALTWAEDTHGGVQFTFRLLDPSGAPIDQNMPWSNALTGQHTLVVIQYISRVNSA